MKTLTAHRIKRIRQVIKARNNRLEALHADILKAYNGDIEHLKAGYKAPAFTLPKTTTKEYANKRKGTWQGPIFQVEKDEPTEYTSNENPIIGEDDETLPETRRQFRQSETDRNAYIADVE